MTNKIQLIAILTLTSILITGGFGLTQLAYSSGSSNDKKVDDKKVDDKKVDDKKVDDKKVDDKKDYVMKHDDEDDDEHDDEDDGEHDGKHDGKPKTATITLYKAVTTDNKLAPITDPDFKLKITNTTKMIDVPSGSTIIVDAGTYQMSETEIDGYKFVLIAGDTQCPSKLLTDFIVKGGDKIECTIYNEDKFVEGQTGGDGVFFARNSIQMNIVDTVFNEANSLHGCSNVPDGIVRPCVTEDSDGFLLIVDPGFDENGGEFAAVVYTVQPDLGNTGFAQCSSIVGIGEHMFTGVTDPVRGFLLDCSAIDDAGNYNINYAIIKTTQVPT